MNPHCTAIATATILLASGIVAQTPTCWETNFGTAVSPSGGADTGLAAITLPFSFPVPGGGTTTQIKASTNGFLWLDGTSTDNNSVPLISDPTHGFLDLAPRICVGYADLDLDPLDSPNNGLYVNTSFATRAVITFVGNDWLSSPLNTVIMQAQLFSDGSFILAYKNVDPYLGTSTSVLHDMLVGVSQGGGAIDPGEVDFSAGPVMGGTNPTIYEFFPNPNVTAGDPRDLDSIPALLFFPNGTGSYNVAALPCNFALGAARGTGCPAPNFADGYVFEFFTGGTNDLIGRSILYQRQPNGGYQATISSSVVWQLGYSNRIDTLAGIWGTGTGDDSISLPQPLGFTASFWDNPPSTDAYVASNGRVYTASGGNTALGPTATTLNSGPCCIALWSDDLDCRTASIPVGGGLYVDQYPGKLVITYDQIPTYSSSPPSGESFTGQVQLFQSGDVLVSIAASTITGDHRCGFFRGGQSGTLADTIDGTDLSTAMVAPGLGLGIPTVPITHACDKIVLGSMPTARASAIPLGALATVLHLGVDQTNLPLNAIGMPGCSAYTTILVATAFMTPGTSNDAALSLGSIPSSPALVGVLFTTQAIAFVPGINALSLVASNGWDSTMGL